MPWRLRLALRNYYQSVGPRLGVFLRLTKCRGRGTCSQVLLRFAKGPKVSTFMRLSALFLKIFAVCSLFSGTALTASPNAQPAPQEDRQPTLLFVHNPEAAPDFQLQTLDGESLKLADANGTPGSVTPATCRPGALRSAMYQMFGTESPRCMSFESSGFPVAVNRPAIAHALEPG